MNRHISSGTPLFRGMVLLAVLSCSISDAYAAIITLGLDVEFSGGADPEGSAPWLTAKFDDEVVGGGTVRLTMSTSGLVDAESVKDWAFNLNPILDPTQLNFAVVGTPGSTPNAIVTGVNVFQADGDGKFDIRFDFPPPPGSNAARFTAGETVVYDITYDVPNTLTASSFIFQSVEGGGNGTYTSAAHVQRIGLSDGDSGWIGDSGLNNHGIVPEPTTVGLIALAIGMISTIRLSRRQ
jgi:hypothetical protein